MHLTFKKFDGRSPSLVPVIDQETGDQVGRIWSNGVGADRYGGIEISLFEGRYTATVNRQDECWGFIKGVEAVLNHLLPTNLVRKQDTTAA